jgi:tetratricopeptide (TPR) repeat protein
MRINLHGQNHPAVGDIYDMMGFIHAKSGELDDSLNRLTDSLRVRKLVGDKLTEADTLINIGNLHRKRKEYELAMQHYNESLQIRISAFGRNHSSVADVLMELGNVHSDMSNTQDALARYREGERMGTYCFHSYSST